MRVKFVEVHHGDTEGAEVARRDTRFRISNLKFQIKTPCPLRVLCASVVNLNELKARDAWLVKTRRCHVVEKPHAAVLDSVQQFS
jgi:hypothetical protein